MQNYQLSLVASLVAQTVKRLPAMQETRVRSLGWEDPLEKEMATHSSNLAWKIPWTEEAGAPQSMLSQRVEHDWVTKQVQTAMTWRITFKFMYTLILSHACFSYFKYHKKHYFRKSWKHNEITAQKKMDISFHSFLILDSENYIVKTDVFIT